MSAAEALLLEWTLRCTLQESALEQGWLLVEMEQSFGYGCRFSLLMAVALLIIKDFHASDLQEFFFIDYSFSFINRVRVNGFCLRKTLLHS